MAGHAAPEHDYHLIDPSPWPLVASGACLLWCFGMVIFFAGLAPADSGAAFFFAKGAWPVLIGGTLFGAYSMLAWWKDVTAESRGGDHTPVVQIGLRYGMIMFIMQEAMFFVGWFWMFFELGLFHKARTEPVAGWDNEAVSNFSESFTGGLATVDPWHLPLMNTLILLLSGTTVTWAHHALIHNKRGEAKWGLFLTLVLGAAFTALQALEYMELIAHKGTEPWLDTNTYGSIFIMATGFHGFHVLIGTVFLLVCYLRLLAGGFTPEKHFGFEAAAWYWHFVDVVWIFLFAFVYVLFRTGGTI